MSDVFISYSRRDIDFVRHLFDQLKARDREAWADWQDIPPTADWLAEIYSGIEAADTFLFVISPDSCRHQLSDQKRHLYYMTITRKIYIEDFISAHVIDSLSRWRTAIEVVFIAMSISLTEMMRSHIRTCAITAFNH